MLVCLDLQYFPEYKQAEGNSEDPLPDAAAKKEKVDLQPWTASLPTFFIINSPADTFLTNSRYSDIVLLDSSLERTHPHSDERLKR